MGMMKEFKEFALKGNLVDMAIAFVMGGAFGKVTAAFIDGMVMPAVGMLTGGVDFNDMKKVLKAADAEGNGEVAIKYGAFITVAIEFLVVAFVMFMIIKAINNMKKKEAESPAAPPEPSSTDKLLAEIRDAVRR